MSEQQRRPLARRLQARLMRVVNIPMRALLGLPFATPLGGRLMLVSLTGRRSGRTYHQPLSYVADGEVLLTPGGGRWTLNLLEDRPVTVRLRGRDLLLRAELVRDLDEVDRLLAVMTAANPMVATFVGAPRGADGRLDRARLRAAVDHGFCVVRWRRGSGDAAGEGAA